MKKESPLIALCHSPGDAAYGLADSLVASYDRTRFLDRQDVASTSAFLEQDDSARLCIFYATPVASLTQALQARQAPEDAVQTWLSKAEVLLTLHMHHRSRSMIFEVQHFLQFPDIGLARMGLSSRTGKRQWMAPETGSADPTLTLIAKAIIAENGAVGRIWNRLAASAEALSNDGMTEHAPSDLAAMSLVQQRGQTLRVKEKAAAGRREQDLAGQIEAMRQELKTERAHARQIAEDITRARDEAERTITGLRDEISKLQDTLRLEREGTALSIRQHALMVDDLRGLENTTVEQGKRLAEARQQIVDRDAQISNMQKDLADTGSRLAAKESDLKGAIRNAGALAGDLAASREALSAEQAARRNLDAEVERIMRSRSMRLTAPLRSILRVMRPKSNG